MSSSKTPNGGYTLTSGSNYMLDGFQFDTEYNGGVLEKARLPEAKGLASLPSGMIPTDHPLSSELPTGVEVELDLDLGDFTKEAAQDVPLIDHSWLATNPVEDLEGMRTHEDVLKHFSEGRFENPQANQLKTLQDSWASGSTTGLDMLPNTQRKHQKYTNPYGNQSQLPGDDYRQKVEQGSRRVAYGKETLSEIVDSLSEGGQVASRLASDLADEYGLHGRVYVKESSFPGLFNGRWDEVINKRCATSMYIIPNNPDCAFDRFLGMKVVASVDDIPWKEAYQTLMPKLETYGVTKVSSSSYAAMLKQAFTDLMEGRVETPLQSSSWFHIQPDMTNLISIDRAKVALEQFEAESPYIESQEERFASKTEQRLQRIASQLVSQGFLDGEQVSAIVESDKTASKKIERLFELASQPVESRSYEGQGKNASYHNLRKHQTDASAYVPEKGSRELARRNEVARNKVAGLIKANLITLAEVERVTKSASTPEDKLGEVLKFIQSKTEKVATYQGEVDNFEARLSSTELAQIQESFFNRQASQSKEAYEKQVMGQIGALIDSGVVSMSQFEQVLKKHASLEGRLHALYEMVSKPVYVKKASGQTGHYGAQFSKQAELVYTASDWSKAQAKVSKLVETGLLTQDQVDAISNSENPNDFVKKAFDMASTPAEAGQYQGEATAHVLGTKKSSAMSATEMKVATWIRQKISEGSAGQELDVLIASRFNQDIVNEYGSRIASIRAEHEGISGHAYVDASAYMTEGVEGCEKGALIHRANQIPALLKTAKCGTCVFNSGGSCQKYNKRIASSVDEIVERPEDYRQEMIRLANASDSEQTASLFVNNYDANEFNLTASQDVSVDDGLSPDLLGDVLFGGFDV